MTKLLSAGFSRLRLSKIFWLGMLFMFGISVFVVVNQHLKSIEYGYATKLDNFVLGFTIIIPMLSAVFSSLFLGTEYSDGTMRNKLIVGHSRAAIYLSSLALNIAAALLMCLAFALGVFAVGLPLLGGLTIGLPRFLAMLLGGLVMVCAICAILTAICMLISSKAIMAIVCILGMLLLTIEAISINDRLHEPEFNTNVIMLVDGEMQQSDNQMPNPNYLTGAKRAAYELAFDILPTGQAMQYTSMTAEHLWQMPLYSLAIIAASTGIGLFFYTRKDLK